jgi:hypothetical protein
VKLDKDLDPRSAWQGMINSSLYRFSFCKLYMFIPAVLFIAINLSNLFCRIISCLMPDHTSNMINLFVLILQSCCLCCYLFIFSCSIIIHVPCLFAYYIYMIHMFCVLMIYIIMDNFEIMLSMFDYLLYVIIIMLIYGIKMVRKMPIFLTLPWR